MSRRTHGRTRQYTRTPDLLRASVAAGLVWALIASAAVGALVAGGSTHEVPAAGFLEASPAGQPIAVKHPGSAEAIASEPAPGSEDSANHRDAEEGE